MTSQRQARAARGTVFAVGLFYLLIVFEFFYMASPFAAYLYGAYLPGLELLERERRLAWLTRFFLPHFSETSSDLLNSAPIVGGVITAIGMLGFAIGAAQVYSRKLLRRGAAAGGMYRFVRHPQYASLIVAGAGMLLLWPRMLMIAFFVVMLGAYRLLASIEEGECVRKYGQSYVDYRSHTPRFLPFDLLPPSIRPRWFDRRPLGAAKTVFAHAAFAASAFAAAHLVQRYSVRHLYSYSSDAAVHVSLTEMRGDALQRTANVAMADTSVRHWFGTLEDEGARLIGYVMPWEWAVPELPMNAADDHRAPDAFDRRRVKIVYTRAVLPGHDQAKGLEIVRYASRVEPVVEVWMDGQGRVARVAKPPESSRYGAVPVPVF